MSNASPWCHSSPGDLPSSPGSTQPRKRLPCPGSDTTGKKTKSDLIAIAKFKEEHSSGTGHNCLEHLTPTNGEYTCDLCHRKYSQHEVNMMQPTPEKHPGCIFIKSGGHGNNTFVTDGDTGELVEHIQRVDIEIRGGDPAYARLTTMMPIMDMVISKKNVTITGEGDNLSDLLNAKAQELYDDHFNNLDSPEKIVVYEEFLEDLFPVKCKLRDLPEDDPVLEFAASTSKPKLNITSNTKEGIPMLELKCECGTTMKGGYCPKCETKLDEGAYRLALWKKKYGDKAVNGYVEDNTYNDEWGRMGLICGYEHCIEHQPLTDPRTSISCPNFGHDCPGGEKVAKECWEQYNEMMKRTVHLCSDCLKDPATCEANPEFGTGEGNDNVYECDGHESKGPTSPEEASDARDNAAEAQE